MQLIANTSVRGDLANNQLSPGGEAQLDVEYLMALAPGAQTYFYSLSDLNPYSQENEGFLAWVTMLGNEEAPPLVHSLSYGDVEASIFNASAPGAREYAARVDDECVKMLSPRGR